MKICQLRGEWENTDCKSTSLQFKRKASKYSIQGTNNNKAICNSKASLSVSDLKCEESYKPFSWSEKEIQHRASAFTQSTREMKRNIKTYTKNRTNTTRSIHLSFPKSVMSNGEHYPGGLKKGREGVDSTSDGRNFRMTPHSVVPLS